MFLSFMLLAAILGALTVQGDGLPEYVQIAVKDNGVASEFRMETKQRTNLTTYDLSDL